MHFKRSLFALSLVGSTFACGDLGKEDGGPPLVLIDGQLSRTSTALEPAGSKVRVALIWNTNGEFKSTHDVEVVAVFPSRFRLELRDPPPAAAMSEAPFEATDDAHADPTEDAVGGRSRPATRGAPGYRYAVGTIVAYEDLNGNGQLDLITADSPPIDRVLGANEAFGIVYIEGTPPSELMAAVGSPVRGYNLLKRPPCTLFSPLSSVPPPCARAAWLPISTTYDLPLSADPQLAEMMCRSNSGTSEATSTVWPSEIPVGPGPNGWPAKDTFGLLCSADGKSYSLTRCEAKSKGLCKGTIESCAAEAYRTPEPPPAEWPCTK
jgi:hypothetical protein